MSYISELKERLIDAEAERDYLLSLVETFETGELPAGGADFRHFIFAKWGRKRQDEMKKQPTLLRSE